MSLIPKKSKLVKNAEELSGNKRDMRKKIVKSNTKQSDLKRAMTKMKQGGLASFIEVEDQPISITPIEFSEYSFPLSNTYIDIKQKEQPVEFEEESTISSKYVPLNNKEQKPGNISFDKLINEVGQSNDSVRNLKKFLTETARAESNFDFNIQNKAGAPAYGAFQFMDFNIKPLGVSVEQFRNNPKLQIEAAANLANQFKSQFTEEDKRLAKEKGYNENALLAGAWLGGVGGVRKVLRGQGNPSDKHWSKEGKGTTVKDRMDKFNKMKEGGVLKYEDGKKVDPAILEYWKKQNVVLPSPKNEQVSADNGTKELKEAQQRDIKTKQLGNTIKDMALNTAEGVTSMVYPYVGAALSLKNAYTNPNGAYIDAAATMLGGASKPITKLISKTKIGIPKQFGNTSKVDNSLIHNLGPKGSSMANNYTGSDKDLIAFYNYMSEPTTLERVKNIDNELGTNTGKAVKAYLDVASESPNRQVFQGDSYLFSKAIKGGTHGNSAPAKGFVNDPFNTNNYALTVLEGASPSTLGHETKHILDFMEWGSRMPKEEFVKLNASAKASSFANSPRLKKLVENNIVDYNTFRNRFKVKYPNMTEEQIMEKYNYYKTPTEVSSYMHPIVQERIRTGRKGVFDYSNRAEFEEDLANSLINEKADDGTSIIYNMIIKDKDKFIQALNKYGYAIPPLATGTALISKTKSDDK